MTDIAKLIDAELAERELEYTRKGEGQFVVELPGERKLKTTCLLTVGAHGVRVEAFVCRKPDENFEGVYRYLLRRNRRLYGVSYTIDKIGDIYLLGQISTHAVTGSELDRVLGQVLEAADGDFNTLLELGFATSIRREWDWRVSRGEPLTNLQPFVHLMSADQVRAAGSD
ncbi:YbjN domain-containing protein [Rhodococcus sp. NPDC055112]